MLLRRKLPHAIRAWQATAAASTTSTTRTFSSASSTPLHNGLVTHSDEVANALAAGDPIVALESTIISHGMPYPQNLDTAREVEAIVRAHGATPATVAIMDGTINVGLEDFHMERLAKEGQSATKCSRRDISLVCARGGIGATTVSGTMIASELAGIEVFVTGGIGGVHRGVEDTMDVSADLSELGRTPVVVVCAGVKSILDIPRTLEYLETQGVAVMGWNTDAFPAFFTVDSGKRAPIRVDTPEEVAAWLRVNKDLGLKSGAVVAVPNPDPADQAVVDGALEQALREVKNGRIAGKEATPYLLKRLNELTGGESLRSNIALVKNNAIVGSQIAVSRATMQKTMRRMPQGVRTISSAVTTVAAPAVASPAESACSSLPLYTSSFSTSTSLSMVFDSKDRGNPIIFGGATADIISYGSGEVRHGTSTVGYVQHTHGGAGRNVSECLGRVWCHDGDIAKGDDRRPVFASVVGCDETGKAICCALDDVGIDTSHIKFVEGQRTAIYNAILDADGDLIAAIADMDILDNIDVTMVQTVLKKIGKRPAMVIVDGNLSEAVLGLICAEWRASARSPSNSVPIWFEPTSVLKATRVCSAEVLPHVHLISPNTDELRAIAQMLELEEKDDVILATMVAEYMSQEAVAAGVPPEDTLRHVLVTMGADGAIVATAANGGVRSSAVHIDPPGGPILNMKNCTGAGDCLLGTTAACVLRWPDLKIEDAVLAGMEAAKYTISSSEAVSPSLNSKWLESIVQCRRSPKL